MMTDEMVTPGHPDKIADKISDALLNIALKENKETKNESKKSFTT